MCRQKDAKTVQGCALKTRSPCCAGYGFGFFGCEKSKSVLHADGLKKSLRRIFIAAALERRTANHHPCPLLKGGELRGRKANNLRSAAHLSASHGPAPQPPRPSPSASPNIPRASDCRPDFASPSGPLSRHRERGWGERADALRLPWERFCAQYGLILDCRPKSIRIQHSQRQGSWGSAPSVFCLLLYEQK